MNLSFSEFLHYSAHKTRVLLYTKQPNAAKIFLEILNFYEKDFDVFLANGFMKFEENDFVIFETAAEEEAAQFKPNIVFISQERDLNGTNLIFNTIIPGGILIYPVALETEVEASPNYFRKLPFSKSTFQKIDEKIILSTEIGSIPLQSKDENLVNNLNGLQILAQQFGIMEEDFYEAVMNFS